MTDNILQTESVAICATQNATCLVCIEQYISTGSKPAPPVS